MLTHQPLASQSRSEGASRSRFLHRMASALAICAAVVCFWRGAPSSWTVGEAAQVAPGATTVVESAADRLNETPGSRQLVTRPIRDIHPGMRVLADNPELSGEELRDAAIGPDSWRLVKLHLTKPDGSALDMELLRPRDWLALNALDALLTSDDPTVGLPRPLIVRVEDAGLADVLLGRTIDVDLPELGAQGPATVRAIEPCPPIESSNGSGRRVVTGTFRHTAGNVIDVSVEGLAEPIGTTDNHPFWSEDRQSFVPAGELRIGEYLRRADGQLARVTSVVPRGGVQAVYNLEVDAEHVYCVSASGVWVHNNYFHGYGIFNKNTGEIYKFGVSRRGFDVNGLSIRAQEQLAGLAQKHGVSKDDLASVVLARFSNATDMFQWEHDTVGIFHAFGHRLIDNILPDGVNPFNP